MPKQGAKTLPLDVQRKLDQATKRLELALWKLSQGAPLREVGPDFQLILDEPIQAATLAGESARRSRLPREVDFGTVIREAIAARRRKAELTQEALAAEMRSRGFDWKRITVAEVETGTRKVALEELLALAELFGETMVRFLLPDEHDHLLGMSGKQARTLILGDKEASS